MRSVVLIGAGGLAREVIALLEGSTEYKPIGLLDDNTTMHGADMGGVRVLGGIDSAGHHDESDFLVCTGSGRSRRLIVDRLLRLGVDSARYATVVAPDVRVPADSTVGAGSILLAGTVLTTSVSIGRHAVLMPRVVCTHDNKVADFGTLCAGVTLGGSVVVGEAAYLGMNSAVRQNVRIGVGAVLGMGSVLLTDLPADEVWAGNPAHAINNGDSRE